ncbi:MAG: methyltransferase domain-containing protein [Desulfobaccales bacterium]|jgi:SAM-dependent methyltransferase
MTLSVDSSESAPGYIYRRIYDGICGHHPNLRPWHFQWLGIFYLYRQLRRILPEMGGKVLDVGCGGKPYRSWFGPVSEYIGLDVSPGPAVDVLVAPDGAWPLPDEHFDGLLSTQVMQYVANLHLSLAEMERVLKRGGVAVLSLPFLYNEHRAPWDYWRFTVYGAERLFPGFEITHLEKQGGIGSTLAILFLNCLEMSMNYTLATRLLKGLLLPIFLLLSLVVNFLGLLMDRLDHTGAFYNNVLLVVRKPL